MYLSILLFLIIATAIFLYNYYVAGTNIKIDPTTVSITKESNSQVNKSECEVTGNKWQAVGISQTYTCVIQYTDWGKSCDSSSQCQWDCIVKRSDDPWMCAANNNVFGCKNTIENVAAWEWILCID